jgi:hypothetical protein
MRVDTIGSSTAPLSSVRASVTSAEEDLNARRPVWEALSTLFLDTDTSLLRDHRSAVLARSPYSVAELEEILSDEVFPICSWNLLSVAGEWAEFDGDWLERTIVRRLQKRWRWRIGFGRYLVARSLEWRRTRGAVEAFRRRG